MRMRIRPLVCFLLLVPMLAWGAKVAPISELDVLPEDQDEDELWVLASSHENNIANSGRLWRESSVEAFLEGMAAQIIGNDLQHIDIDIDFILVKEPTLSAWVYPYGTIAVHTGLLAAMDNEAQLAAIICHELSHFLRRHSYRELIAERRQSAIGKGLGLLASLAVASQTGTFDPNLMKVGEFWSDLVTSGYSRELEHDADAEGLQLMKKGNYVRAEAVTAFRNLAQNDIYGAVKVSQIWSSHPKLEDRIQNLIAAVDEEQKQKNFVAGQPRDSLAYYRAIAPALMTNAELDFEAGQFGRARAALEKYASVRSDDAYAQFLIGESYRRETPDGPDFTTRIASYQRALEHDPRLAPAHLELGMTYRQQGMAQQARTHLETYLKLARDTPEAGIVAWYLESL